MDAQRFGKAMGIGVRATASALKTAAEAAAAPNPRPFRPVKPVQPAQDFPPSHPQNASPAGNAGRIVARGVVQGRVTAAGVKRGGKRFGEAVWGPAARAGGVLFYEVTGSFFALFAFAAGAETWKRHLDLFAASAARGKAWFAVAMLAAFTWFTVSSFAKARRRSRQA